MSELIELPSCASSSASFCRRVLQPPPSVLLPVLVAFHSSVPRENTWPLRHGSTSCRDKRHQSTSGARN